MAKRSNNNSTGRRAYGEKPYDVNNSFVKKMATKVTDLIPQRSWISKWFNSPGGIGDVTNEGDNADEQDIEEETLQPPSKRPRIRMDMTHPPGTFMIQPRSRGLNTNHEPPREEYPLRDETLDDFPQPSLVVGPSRAFASSTPAIRVEVQVHNSNASGPNLNNLVQRQQQNNGATNGTDDNSESSESTSGCSSLIPQTNRQEGLSTYGNSTFANRKGLVDDKLSFTNHLQSPRSLFLDGRESMSSRRPSFNASIVNNDSSALERSSSMLSSPFYSGNTTFGGTNAIGHFRKRTGHQGSGHDFHLKVPRRASIRVQPSNNPAVSDSTGMSQTAKRILEALEHFSSPISDAKKIPVKTPMNSFSTGKKRAREEDLPPTSRVGLRHLTRELAIPTVPDMLKLKRRQRLQDTTLAARRIVSANSEPAPSIQAATTSSTETSKEYHLRMENDSKKFLGKLRAKSKKKPDEELVETINLSGIPLPITSLPSFDIPLPEMSSTSNAGTKSQTKLPTSQDALFKFSSPIKFNEASKNLKSINHFRFSEPINANGQKDNIDSTPISFNFTSKSPVSSSNSSTNFSNSQPAMNFMWSGSNTAPRPKEKKVEEQPEEEVEISSGMKVASELKSGSVMDILGKKSNKIEMSIWECGECFIKNNDNEEQCVACKARKPDPTKKLSSTITNASASAGGNNTQFGAQFKMGKDKWECSSCLVRNPRTETTCLSCMTPEQKKIETESTSFTGLKPAKSDLLDKFKPAEGSWECSGCMLRNPSNVIACPCCNSSKPDLVKITQKNSSNESKKNDNTLAKFQSTIAPKSWECPSCMVRNDATASACVCCTTPCPGGKQPPSASITSSSNASGFGDKFKKPEGMWTCNTCMVQNKAEANKCVACEELKPGTIVNSKSEGSTGGSTLQFNFGIPSNASQFKFGIPKTDEKKSDTPTNGFTFGIPTTQQSNQTFTFGIPASEKSQAPSGLTFTSPKSNDNGAEKSKSNSGKSNQTVSGGFSFGVPKAEENKTTATNTSESASKSNPFIFGAAKTQASVDSKESDKPSLFSNTTATTTTTTPSENNQTSANTSTQGATSIDKTLETSKPTATPAFSFVAPGSVTTTAESNAVLSASSTTSLSANQAPFTFSAPKPSAPGSPLISFGQTSSSATSQTAAPSGFSFTDPKFTNSNQMTPPDKKPAISFGSTPVATLVFGLAASSSSTASTDNSGVDRKSTNSPFATPSNLDQKPSGFAIEEKVPSFGTADSKPAFGEVESKTPAAAAPSAFGSNEKSMFNAVTPSFGMTPASSTGSPAPPLFGSSSTPSIFGSASGSAFGTPSPAAPNMFAAVKPAEQPNATLSTPGLFSFGAASSQQPTPTPNESFNFTGGNGASAPAAQKPVFGFGSTATAATATPAQPAAGATFGTPNFGTAASNNPTPAPAFSFNAPKTDGPPPAFGQASATPLSSIFGNNPTPASLGPSSAATSFSATPGSSGGFNFGTPNPANATSASSASSGFNFSAGLPPATPGGFNFNAPSPSPAIAFDPNTRPSFNFTGGTAPTMFNATPAVQQPAGGRKIKKAVRRMPPRT